LAAIGEAVIVKLRGFEADDCYEERRATKIAQKAEIIGTAEILAPSSAHRTPLVGIYDCVRTRFPYMPFFAAKAQLDFTVRVSRR
jgi:hypothetical protein